MPSPYQEKRGFHHSQLLPIRNSIDFVGCVIIFEPTEGIEDNFFFTSLHAKFPAKAQLRKLILVNHIFFLYFKLFKKILYYKLLKSQKP